MYGNFKRDELNIKFTQRECARGVGIFVIFLCLAFANDLLRHQIKIVALFQLQKTKFNFTILISGKCIG